MKALLILLPVAIILAADDQPNYEKIGEGEPSPQRDLTVENYREHGGNRQQIWLVSAADPAKRQLLFTHERHAEVLFSPDEQWLVINNHHLSNEARLLLYSRKAPLEYKETADITDAAWKFFSKRNGQQGDGAPGFDHTYVDALRWAENKPPVLLLSLKGHADSHNHTDEWYCFYDVQARRFHTDLDSHNKAVTALE